MKLDVLNTRFLKYGFISAVTLFLFSCKKETATTEAKADTTAVATTDVRFPAEFEPQESVWMGHLESSLIALWYANLSYASCKLTVTSSPVARSR